MILADLLDNQVFLALASVVLVALTFFFLWLVWRAFLVFVYICCESGTWLKKKARDAVEGKDPLA